ncbi:zinc finger protein 287-like [Pieris napi]|uniref:zinc finger protein 287-like n=1 Tax=Pieris napi TaxID=78633 RepID=UPI001FB9E697|nr:zinc finger protein 287-like [Pieris napi]
MGLPTICRCCLAKGMHTDMDIPNIYEGKKEIYFKMLQECFNIDLSTQKKSKAICNKCITRLRDAYDFMQQVLYTEEIITTILEENNTVEESDELKSEDDSPDGLYLNIDDDVSFEVKSDNSDDLDNSDNVEEKESKGKEVIKPSGAMMKPSTKKSSRKSRSETKVSKLTRPLHENDKHKKNLATLLKYSNILVFKDRTPAGIICGYCDEAFEDPLELRSHTDSEHASERLFTPLDYKKYPIKLEISNLKCTICDEDIDNLQALKEHLVNRHDLFIYNDIKDYLMSFKFTSDSFNCTMCTSKYKTFKMLKQHMNIHYMNHICHCGSTFITKRSLSAHKTTHIEGSYKCDFCERVFSNNTKKIYHQRTLHLGRRTIRNCPYCEESFPTHYQQYQHMVKVHKTEALYKCNICKRGYMRKTLLMKHIKKYHMMERNHRCVECGCKFFNSRSLRLHMVKHTGQKKYECKICKKTYGRNTTLTAHMRIHNNDRRFKCDICDSAFVQKCSLKSHLLSHHGVIKSSSEIFAKI